MALICQHFKVPFYVAAPTSTIDKTLSNGRGIRIEQRDKKEISPYWAEKGTDIWNPSFDITPKELITGIITEEKIIEP